ncbi:general stress protein [Cohnella sp. CIP 111063]|uniref:NAD(P)H-dependent oxidoreductase n=1 Tax=unclassified Cohnella TaxID=2636738 RepID=UPI000B8BB648|nr:MULTISPECIES: NAD(P)H-dependent oxidoreductase [unclassified Cohnella]OXS58062.1 general stress protein [Cohnella sp. CIP 111063]PRX71403.1 glutathione-regulated potassium-efflux system ancillary protein KefG [Cohnella sp. SGD-V74]
MKIMVIVAHPQLNNSRANRAFMLELGNRPDIHVRDLYQEYPNWEIDVEKEQRLLLQYDRIVLQFPLFWYSCPPLLKKWFDDVFTHGWAFGPGGDNLEGKEFMITTTVGGTENQYRSGGFNKFTISELLRPLQRTIARCNGSYLPAFVAYNANAGSDAYLDREAEKYAEHILAPMLELVQ